MFRAQLALISHLIGRVSAGPGPIPASIPGRAAVRAR